MLLNIHSFYSLRYGTIPMGELIDQLQIHGYDSGVLTDINNSSGALEFIKLCQQKGFNGLVGIEFRAGDKVLYIGIAKNNDGFRELNALLTTCNITGVSLPLHAPAFEHAFVIYPFGATPAEKLRDNEYIGIKASQLNKLFRVPLRQQERLVIWQPLSFHRPEDFRLHCQLRAITHNVLLSHLKPWQAGGRDELIKSRRQVLADFGNHPHIIANTERLLAACNFHFDFTTPKNKQLFTDSRYNDTLLLEKLALEGMASRYGNNHPEALRRVKKELAVIDQLGFCSYFLITWDMILKMMSRGMPHVGRGSGANSIVAYCLFITNVCPIELDLYFERFLNHKRKTPPDFDIDFSHRDRDAVFAYMFGKYGKEHTAILGTMGTFKDRSIIREIGKIYGLPKEEIDRLISQPGAAVNKNPIAAKVMEVFKNLPGGFPNLRSVHAGGILISELPITSYTALDMPPKGLGTTQFDMYLAEEIGFAKLDILSQRGIGNIKEATSIIETNQGVAVDINAVSTFFEDQQVKQRLRSAQAIGCFYIESPTMRGVLTKLRCDNYITLVAASSIIRPGVGSSGMMRTFIDRYHNPNGFSYAHPVLKEQLSETFGVMIYQEDVLKVGVHYAGLSAEDADLLRRTMSGKDRGGHHLVALQNRFFANCAASGHDPMITAEIWRQIRSFAGYSFSKAHSASFAVESYQCLYLKSHYPLEYLVAVINNEGGFYARKVYIEEARKEGGTVHLPCVNHSQQYTCIYGTDIYLGLNMIQKITTETIEKVVSRRPRIGGYANLEDFVNRTAITLDQLHLLVRVGALRFTGEDKKTLLWKSYVFRPASVVRSSEAPLITTNGKQIILPQFDTHPDEHYYDEMELLRFVVSMHPLDILRTAFRGDIMAADMRRHVGRVVRMVGHYIVGKPLYTKKGEPMLFATFWDAQSNYIDTVHFSQSLRNYPVQGAGNYLMEGKVIIENDFPTLDVMRIAKLPIRPDPRLE